MPPIPEPAEPASEAEAAALELIASARQEAEEQARCAAYHRDRATAHAQLQVELLRLAALTEAVIWE